ncbi:MAG: LysM domain-containing protein [Nitrosospira sp.]
MFPVTSRYYGIEIARYKTLEGLGTEGREIVYLRRRFLPPRSGTSAGAAIAEHTVTQNERLDNITARYLGDPAQFWRVCDANNAMQPRELTAEIGRRLYIAFPQSGAI